MFDLTGKTALVTGATGGIGAAIAKVLHKAGATVAISGTRAQVLEELKAELGGERVFVLPCNLSDASAVEKLVPEAPRLYIICGGGRLNPTLIQDLRDILQATVITAENVAMNGDSMEAEAWAYLAVRCLRGLAITFPGTTGVTHPLSGGIVARP